MKQKNQHVMISATPAVAKASVQAPQIATIHESNRWNKIALTIAIVLIVVSPWVSYFVPGQTGIALNYLLAFVGLPVGYKAVTKMRQIDRWH